MKQIISVIALIFLTLALNAQDTVAPLKLTVAEWVKKDSLLMIQEFPTHLVFWTDSTANFTKSSNPAIVPFRRQWKFSHKDELYCYYADAEEGITFWRNPSGTLEVSLYDFNRKLSEVSVYQLNKNGKRKNGGVWFIPAD